MLKTIALTVAALASFTGFVAQTPTGVIVGVVVDRDSGKPIPDATVSVTIRPLPGAVTVPVLQRVMTDPSGRFAFTGLPAGALLLRAIKAGYAKADTTLRLDPAGGMADVELHDGERVTNAILTLSKYASISGRVVDDLGDPVVDVTVRVHRRVYDSGHPRLDYGVTGRTDDRGLYRIATLLPGEYVVVVPARQSTMPVSVVTDYMTAGAAGNIGALLDTLGTGSISVLGSTGAQRVGNQVLQSPSGSYYPPDSSDVSRAAAYQTTFAPSTPVPSAATVVVLESGDERSGVDVQLALAPTVPVSGSVSGPDGAVPLAALSLRLASGELQDSPEFSWATALSDDSGAFTFLNVPPGQYVLRASKRPARTEGYQETYKLWSDQVLTVGETPVDAVRVTLRRPMRVTGQVKFEGANPPSSAAELARLQQVQPLFLLDAVDRSAIAIPKTEPTGSFATSEVPAGRYAITSTVRGPWSLKAATWQGRDITRSPLELKDGDVSGVVVTFTDRPARIAGTVRTAQGAPDKTATVLLFPTDPAAWLDDSQIPLRLLNVHAALTGAYTFDRVTAGDYFLVAVVETPAATGALDVPGHLRDWLSPAFLRAVSGAAVRVHVTDSEVVTKDLKTTVIR